MTDAELDAIILADVQAAVDYVREVGGDNQSTYVDHGFGWACMDCLFMLANGEVENWSEEQTQEWREKVQARLGDVNVDLGGEHAEDCPNMAEDGSWVGESDCYCEHDEFSWRPCDVCGSALGGSRDAVHFYKMGEGS